MLFVVRNCATERCALHFWSVYYLVESSQFQTSEVQLLGGSLVCARFQKMTFTLIKQTTLQWNQTWVHTKHESNIKKAVAEGDMKGKDRWEDCAPELLNEILSLFDDIYSELQSGLLLLPETLDQVLNSLHRLGIHIVQQFLLQILQPCPQLCTKHTYVNLSLSFFCFTSVRKLS